ncbi:MAG: tRNA lysidine(34) synthetase TilS [bacterium]
MLLQIQRTIEEQRLLKGVKSLLLAVSGGSDSVALLHAMAGLSPTAGVKLSVAHFNHHIRGRAADEDAEFVRGLAVRLKLPFRMGEGDVPAIARRRGISLEMAARDARYAFLRNAAQEIGAQAVATAHTADDQAETIILRLMRGAGGTGLGGIRYRADINGLRVIRPMLDVGKVDAVGFLKGMGATWREDKSNSDLEFQRNMVRHEILPLLEAKLNPRVRKALLQTGRILRDEDEWLDTLAAGILRQCVAARSPAVLSLSSFSRHPIAARRRVLRLWLSANGVLPELLDFDMIARVDAIVRGVRAADTTCLAGGWRVTRGEGSLVLNRTRTMPDATFRVAVKVPGETVLAEQGLRIIVDVAAGIVRDRPRGPGQLPARATLSLSRLKSRKLYVRSWRPGDRMHPFGLDGSKKIQDVFVDGKVPRAERGTIPVFECGSQVIWLPGYRIDRSWAVERAAHMALQILVDKL